MSKKQNIKEELEGLNGSILAQWQGRAKDWQMPDNYLADLADEVIAGSKQEKNGKIIAFRRSSAWKIAAAVFLALAGTWVFYSLQTQADVLPLAALDDLSSEQVQDYVLKNIDDFDMELLESYTMETNNNFSSEANNQAFDSYEPEGDWLEENTDIDLF